MALACIADDVSTCSRLPEDCFGCEHLREEAAEPACFRCGGALIPGLNTDFCSLACETAYREELDAGTGTCSSTFRGHRCFHSVAAHPELHEDENGWCWTGDEAASERAGVAEQFGLDDSCSHCRREPCTCED